MGLGKGETLMPSKAHRHALCVLGLAYRFGETMEAAPNKRISALAGRVKNQVAFCRQNLWKEALSSREADRIDQRCETLQIPQPVDTPLLTSTVLALLDDLHGFVQRQKEKEALEPILSDTNRIHKNYDRRLDRYEDYEAADRIVASFYEKET